MSQYKFKGGVDHREGGKELVVGEVVDMDDERAAGLRDRFELVGGEPAAAQPSGDQQPPALDTTPLDGTNSDVADAVAKISDVALLRKLAEHEEANKNRKGALDAINSRIESLKAS